MQIRVFLFCLPILAIFHSGRTQSWETVHSASNINLFGLLFLNDSVGFCVGGTLNSGMMLRTDDGGSSWQPTGPAGAKLFYSMRRLNDTLLITTGYEGEIWRSFNSGNSWSLANTPGNAWLTGSYAIGPNVMVACGLDGAIWRTANQGTHWLTQNSGTNSWLLDAHFLDSQIGYVCGTSDMLLRTQNGGQNWARIPSPANGTYHSVWNFSRDTVFLATAAGFVLRTYNSGDTWTNFLLGTRALRRFHFQSNLLGWVVGDRSIFSTQNGGDSWQNEIWDAPPLIEWLDVKPGPGNFIYVCGRDGHIIRMANTLSAEPLSDWGSAALPSPNPTENLLSVPCSAPPCKLNLYSNSGSLIWSGEVHSTAGIIERGNWPAGVYFLENLGSFGINRSKIIWR
jgi:photosystem II stability/assembly factor-like uncharacterized protein